MKKALIIIWAILSTLILCASCGAVVATNIRLMHAEHEIERLDKENRRLIGSMLNVANNEMRLIRSVDNCQDMMRAIVRTRGHERKLTEQLQISATLFDKAQRFR